MSLFDVLEGVDKYMNAMENKNYSRLLGNLCLIVHYIATTEHKDYATEYYLNRIGYTFFTDEEVAIMRVFLENKNLRPGILASLYGRVIMSNFKVNYVI